MDTSSSIWFIFIFVSTTCQNKATFIDNWMQQNQTMPYSIYSAAVGTFENKIYILGGRGNMVSHYNDMITYNIADNTFNASKDSLSKNVNGYGSYSTQIGNVVYILNIENNLLNEIFRYDLAKEAFLESISINVTIRRYYTICLTSYGDDYLVIVDGSVTNNKIYMMDIESQTLYSSNTTWSELNRGYFGCTVHEQQLYIIGGSNLSWPFESFDSIACIDLHSNLFQLDHESFYNVVHLPYGLTRSQAIVFNDLILIIGGDNSQRMTVLDTKTNKTQESSFYAHATHYSSLVIVNETAYSFGGRNGTLYKLEIFQTLNLSSFAPQSPTHYSKNLVNLLLSVLTSAALFGILSMAIQQFCISNFNDKQQLCRMLCVIIFILLATLLNILLYTHMLLHESDDRHNGISIIFYICDGIFCVHGVHLLRMFHIWSLERRYRALNRKMPHCYIILFDIFEIVYFVATIIMYVFIWTFPKTNWVVGCHCFLSFLVFLSALFHFHYVSKIVKASDSKEKSDGSVKHSKRWIVLCRTMAMTLCLASVWNIAVDIDTIYNDAFDGILGNELFDYEMLPYCSRSLLLILSSLAALIWVYQHKETWCQLDSESVCRKASTSTCCTLNRKAKPTDPKRPLLKHTLKKKQQHVQTMKSIDENRLLSSTSIPSLAL